MLNIEQEWNNKPLHIRKAINAARLAHINSTGFSIDEFEDHPELGHVRFCISYFQQGSMWTSWGAISYELLSNRMKASEYMAAMGRDFIDDKPAMKVGTPIQWGDKAQD